MTDAERTAATRPRTLPGGPGEVSEHGGAPPRKLGRYVVLEVLGSGAMGVVYSGFDEQLQRRVAIKRINRRGDEQTRHRSQREALALARLAHPNIVVVHEAFEVDERLCIVMELVAGQTLREWLAERTRSHAEILAVLNQAGRGIAAAHAAGLVHCDLKPDNIMIGDDGRVRVMDFGLARVVDVHPESIHFGASTSDRPGASTQTSAFVGTPGYAAPEQRLGLRADVRSDVFSYCVLAFEALHGRRPFRGRDDAALAAGSSGPSGAVRVPAWLDAVIHRGLATEPAARWPTMDVLLAALDRDPAARRRLRLRALAGLVLAGVLVVLSTYALGALRDASEQARLEEAAASRLDAVEATIARAEAGGDHDTAAAAFRTFIADPEHRRTRALTRAWLAQGDRQREDTVAARAAYADGYVAATTPEDERAALRRLAGAFVTDWDGVGLGRSVALLRARGDHESDLDELGFQAALWRRDLPDATTELGRAGHPHAGFRPLLDHLSRARRLPYSIRAMATLPAGGATRILARDADSHQVVLLDAALTEVGRWRDEGRLSLVPRTPWVVVQTDHEARLIDPQSGAVLGRGAPGLSPLTAYDATGDGVPELFFGRKWPLYGFHRWDDLGLASMRERGAHPGTDASDSTFDASAVVDLDGDGIDELAIGFGPWHRFDLRLFRPTAGGELELIAVRELGRIGGLALVHREQRRLLAALVDNSCTAPELFPEPPHTGGPPGVHMLEWVDGALVEVDFIAVPPGFGRFTAREPVAVGDLDGDGLEDLAFTLNREGTPWLLLLRQTATGFEPLLLAGLELHAGMQLDDDAPQELLVAQSPDMEPLVLGLGTGHTPVLPHRALAQPQPPPPTLTDAWLVHHWHRASDLASLALLDSAAASLRDAALLASDRAMRSALLDRAGELFASTGRTLEVLALEHDVHDDPQVRARARARRALALSRLGRHEDALAEAQALLSEPADDPQTHSARALVAELSALLAPTEQTELRFDRPLAPEWQIHTPGALHRDSSQSVLEFAVPAVDAPVAELPIEWPGGPISLEYELDLERLEFAAGLEISLVDASGEPWLGAALCGQGGGGWLQQVVWLKGGIAPWLIHAERRVPSAIHHRNVSIRMTYFPERGYANVMLADEDDHYIGQLPITTPPIPGPQRLIVGSFNDSTQSSLAIGEIRWLTIRGAHLGALSAEDAARQLPAQLLAEHQPRAALAALLQDASHPRAATLRLIATAELGDLASLARATADVLAQLHDPRWLGDLTLALRRYPLAAAALRSAAGPTLLPVLGSIWAFAPPHRNDVLLHGEILSGLAELERLVPDTAAGRDALRGLLETRAVLRARGDDQRRAPN